MCQNFQICITGWSSRQKTYPWAPPCTYSSFRPPIGMRDCVNGPFLLRDCVQMKNLLRDCVVELRAWCGNGLNVRVRVRDGAKNLFLFAWLCKNGKNMCVIAWKWKNWCLYDARKREKFVRDCVIMEKYVRDCVIGHPREGLLNEHFGTDMQNHNSKNCIFPIVSKISELSASSLPFSKWFGPFPWFWSFSSVQT